MSFPRISLVKAEAEAGLIIAGLEPYCTRIEVAGSIRRRKDNVNDIDIVLVWKGLGFGLITFLRKHRITHSSGGERIIKFKWGPIRIPVQLFQTDEDGWPTSLLIRTGSADHNIMMCTRAKACGLKLSVGKGLLDRRGEPMRGIETEQDIFKALDMNYVEPEDRR